jgi:hypothetical protein
VRLRFPRPTSANLYITGNRQEFRWEALDRPFAELLYLRSTANVPLFEAGAQASPAVVTGKVGKRIVTTRDIQCL